MLPNLPDVRSTLGHVPCNLAKETFTERAKAQEFHPKWLSKAVWALYMLYQLSNPFLMCHVMALLSGYKKAWVEYVVCILVAVSIAFANHFSWCQMGVGYTKHRFFHSFQWVWFVGPVPGSKYCHMNITSFISCDKTDITVSQSIFGAPKWVL